MRQKRLLGTVFNHMLKNDKEVRKLYAQKLSVKKYYNIFTSNINAIENTLGLNCI